MQNFVPVVTLSTEDNAKLLEQLKSDFKEQSTGIHIYNIYIYIYFYIYIYIYIHNI